MSSIRGIFRPKINRIIAGIAIVGLIVGGAYLAYKNGIFADTSYNNTSCNFYLKSLEYDQTSAGTPSGRFNIYSFGTPGTSGTIPITTSEIERLGRGVYLGKDSFYTTTSVGKGYWLSSTNSGKIIGTTEVTDQSGSSSSLNITEESRNNSLAGRVTTKLFDCKAGEKFDVYFNIKNTGPNFIRVIRTYSPVTNNDSNLVCTRHRGTGQLQRITQSQIDQSGSELYDVLAPSACDSLEEGPPTDNDPVITVGGTGSGTTQSSCPQGQALMIVRNGAPACTPCSEINPSDIYNQSEYSSQCTSPSAPAATQPERKCVKIDDDWKIFSKLSSGVWSSPPLTLSDQEISNQPQDASFNSCNAPASAEPADGDLPAGATATCPNTKICVRSTSGIPGADGNPVYDGTPRCIDPQTQGADETIVANSECNSPSTADPTDLPPGSTAGQATPVQGCPSGYKCLKNSEDNKTKCYDPVAANAAPANWSEVPASQCTHQATSGLPTAIGQQPGQLQVSTGSAQQAVQFQNKVGFTAYRESELEASGVVPVGNVRFTISHLPSDRANYPSISQLQTAGASRITTAKTSAECGLFEIGSASTWMNIRNAFIRPTQTFTTPDTGGQQIPTQTINMAPGNYIVQYFKSGFASDISGMNKVICFKLGENEGLENSVVSINALLYPERGAEAPGVSVSRAQNTSTNGSATGLGIQYWPDTNGKDSYWLLSNGTTYKYMDQFPWKGWQRSESFNYGTPAGTTPAGMMDLGFSNYLPNGMTIQQALSNCQNFGVSLNLGNISRETLAWVGGLIGLYDGIRDDASTGTTIGRTLMGAAAGLGIGSLTEGTDAQVSYNFGEINQNCQGVFNNQILSGCQQCTSPITNVLNRAVCPDSCIAQNPQLMLILRMMSQR